MLPCMQQVQQQQHYIAISCGSGSIGISRQHYAVYSCWLLQQCVAIVQQWLVDWGTCVT
jgi:hypothetical protein